MTEPCRSVKIFGTLSKTLWKFQFGTVPMVPSN